MLHPNVFPGSRLKVFDPRLFVNDIITPDCMRAATVVCRYGIKSHFIARDHGEVASRYPDLVDVIFDHRPEKVSKGHFTYAIEVLEEIDDE